MLAGMEFLSYQDMIDELDRAIARAGNTARFAEQLGLTAAYLSQVKSGKRLPSVRLLDALGMEKVTAYRRTRR